MHLKAGQIIEAEHGAEAFEILEVLGEGRTGEVYDVRSVLAPGVGSEFRRRLAAMTGELAESYAAKDRGLRDLNGYLRALHDAKPVSPVVVNPEAPVACAALAMRLLGKDGPVDAQTVPELVREAMAEDDAVLSLRACPPVGSRCRTSRTPHGSVRVQTEGAETPRPGRCFAVSGSCAAPAGRSLRSTTRSCCAPTSGSTFHRMPRRIPISRIHA